MKIRAVEGYPVCMPYRKVYGGSYYRRRQASFVVVRILTDDGMEGWGEAGTLGTWGETQGVALQLVTEVLGPALVGTDPMNVEAALENMDRFLRGYPYTKAAIEMALYDIAGKALGVPVHVLLGGRCRSVIPVHGGVGLADMDQMVADAVELEAAGFRAIKVKVGIDLRKDLDLVRRVREALGPDRMLIVDANQGYTRKAAREALTAMREFRPLMAEQPLEAADLEGMASLTKDFDVPIIADESVWSPADTLRAASLHAADVFHVYVLKPGGLFRARTCVQIAEAARIPCNVGGMIDLGIGSAAELHLSAALQNVRPDIAPCGIFGPYFLVDDIITERFPMHEGAIPVPMGPGLGVEVDLEKLRTYQRRVHTDYE